MTGAKTVDLAALATLGRTEDNESPDAKAKGERTNVSKRVSSGRAAEQRPRKLFPRAPVAQWMSSGFLNRVRMFDSCRGHGRSTCTPQSFACVAGGSGSGPRGLSGRSRVESEVPKARSGAGSACDVQAVYRTASLKEGSRCQQREGRARRRVS